ncbi:hypothetical protein LCDV1gp005 [Lymphocystis disease virus 1]|uniref:hypothetical protein n=1 Tax=Fish lymphocystis disease virus TaxID=36363 RepID=UPI0000161EAB|nr:hypothetical protein LCDV1gp005 [Lymphocystis disease virus 1]
MNKDCETFFKNSTVNPKTNRKILKNKKTYNKLVKECGDPDAVEDIKIPYRYAGIAAYRKIYDLPTSQLKFNHPSIISQIFNPDVYTLKSRKANRFQIKNIIKKLDLDKIAHCMSGTDTQFIEKLDAFWPIGAGSFGNVYLIKLKNIYFIIKEALLAWCDKSVIESCGKFDDWGVGEVPYELGIQTMINKALDSGITQNFIYTIGAGICKECIIEIFGKAKLGKCYTIVMEAAAYSLAEILDVLTWAESINAIQQLLMGLTILHGEYGILHRDIKAHNILVLPGPTSGYFKYVVEDRTFFIPCMGKIYTIADFGVSQILNPKYKQSNSLLGTRNFKAIRNANPVGWGATAGLEYTLEPFSTKLRPNFYKNKVSLKRNTFYKKWWKTPQKPHGLYTVNHFTKDEDVKPSIKVDLNNMRTFPAQEFIGDIQDVLRIFVGGAQYFQKHRHYGKFVNDPLFNKLKYMTLHDPVFTLVLLYLNPVKYIFPDVLTAFLFPELKSIQTKIEETFVWKTNSSDATD